MINPKLKFCSKCGRTPKYHYWYEKNIAIKNHEIFCSHCPANCVSTFSKKESEAKWNELQALPVKSYAKQVATKIKKVQRV